MWAWECIRSKRKQSFSIASWPPVNQTHTHHTSPLSPLTAVFLGDVLHKPLRLLSVCLGWGSSWGTAATFSRLQQRGRCCQSTAGLQPTALFCLFMAQRPCNSTPSRGREQKSLPLICSLVGRPDRPYFMCSWTATTDLLHLLARKLCRAGPFVEMPEDLSSSWAEILHSPLGARSTGCRRDSDVGHLELVALTRVWVPLINNTQCSFGLQEKQPAQVPWPLLFHWQTFLKNLAAWSLWGEKGVC